MRPERVLQTESKPVQPSSTEQSGSAGRPTGGNNPGKDAGQDRYGQNGLGGAREKETDGQARYRESGRDGADAGTQDGDAAASEKAGTQQQGRKPRSS